MSEVWTATRTGFNRIKTSLRDADEETRSAFRFWVLGLGLMALAIIISFGWPGLMFSVGAVIWKAGSHALNHS